jgi:hypothetical protein
LFRKKDKTKKQWRKEIIRKTDGRKREWKRKLRKRKERK